MREPTTVESILFQWGEWSRVEVEVGPGVARAAGSLEGGWSSPQVWDADPRRQPRIIVIDDQRAMAIEKAVVATGPIFASILRAVYIKRLAPRGRGERDLLHHAHERVAALLGASGCAPEPPERPPRRAADAGDARASGEQF